MLRSEELLKSWETESERFCFKYFFLYFCIHYDTLSEVEAIFISLEKKEKPERRQQQQHDDDDDDEISPRDRSLNSFLPSSRLIPLVSVLTHTQMTTNFNQCEKCHGTYWNIKSLSTAHWALLSLTIYKLSLLESRASERFAFAIANDVINITR